MKSLRKMCLLFQEIYTDRRLLIDLSSKDVKRRFSGTFFGMWWGVLQPALTIVIYWAAFQFGFRSGDVGDTPYGLWFITGIIAWLFISEAISITSNCFIEYNYLIQKIKFNVTILPMVKIFSCFYIHLIFVVIVTVICSCLGFPPKLMILQLVYYMFASIMLIFSIALLVSSIMVFFRDLGQIINVLLLLGMWGTPIAWDMSYFEPQIQNVLKRNLFYYIVDGYRDAILGRQWFWEKTFLGVHFWFITFIIFLIGSFVYVRLRSHFADSI